MPNKKANLSSKISVIGSGAWGCSIADLISKNGFDVSLFVRNKLDHIISRNVAIYSNFDESVKKADFIFIVTPSSVVSGILDNLKGKIEKKAIIVICSKGIENKNGKLFGQILAEKLTNNYAILSGPNFASEVAKEAPTVTTIASDKKAVAAAVCKLLNNNYFLAIPSDDVVTTSISGAVKNIIAIGCGIIDGLKLGDNAKAALITKGVAEISALSKKMGGKIENVLSPAGFGDLFLTCSSTKSRNYSLGFMIGSGKNAEKILSNKNKTYEGANAAKSIIVLAKKYKLNLILCSTIAKVLSSILSKTEIKKIIQTSILTK